MSRNYFVGPSGSGKTTLMVSKLVHEIGNKTKVRMLIFSPTASLQKQYKPLKIYKPQMIPRLDENSCDYLFNELMSKKKWPLITIIDDQGSNTFISKKKDNKLGEINDCALHYNAFLFSCFQQIQQMTTGMRDNYDTLHMFRPDNKKQLKYFREEFCGDLSTETFNRLIQIGWDVKDAHKYITIVRRGGSKNNEKQYFIGEKPFPVTPLGNKFY